MPNNASPTTHRDMRSTSRSVAIGGIADEPLTGTEPPYFTGSHAQRMPNFTRRDIDALCGQPSVLHSRNAGLHTPGALSHSPPATVVLSLGEYRGELRRAIHLMKFRNARWITARFGRNLGRAVHERFDDWRPDFVTWAPTTKRRMRRRGHDQSSIVAANAARSLGVRRVRCLRRIDDRTQTGATRQERRRGPSYVVRDSAVRGKRVLLVDDVMTTGTTLARARAALLSGGAVDVRCAVVAHVRGVRE